MKTFSAKVNEVQQDWFVIDAQDKILGRLASVIASRLRGKHKPQFTPHIDTGDHIVVINVDKIRVSGSKFNSKRYYRHTGYPGGLYVRTFREMQERKSGEVLRKAVKGMLPKGPLGYALIRKLRIYDKAEHPHVAQKPQMLEV